MAINDFENPQIQTAQACNRDISENAPDAKQDCSDIIYISVYFDGTGNNEEDDNNSKSWSNVVRLKQSALSRENRDKGIYVFYLNGVGTPLREDGANWLEKAAAYAVDYTGGNPSGAGGDWRQDIGQRNINDALYQTILAGAKKAGADTTKYAAAGETQSLESLQKALGEHTYIKVINLSLFGFSRGAALARAFANKILNQCKKENGQLTYNKIPIRINFIGVFDTVPSFGLATMNLNWPWKDRDLLIHPEVEQCVHYIAGNEVRFSFPSDRISQNGQYAPNCREYVYPGVHSDIGGGYAPDAQGVSDNYARIPLKHMAAEAVKYGVQLYDYYSLEKASEERFKKYFSILPETETVYNNYKSVVTGNGAVSEATKAHMQAMYSAYGTMHRRGIKSPDIRTREQDGTMAQVGRATIGHSTMADEAETLLKAATAKQIRGAPSPKAVTSVQVQGDKYGQTISAQSWQLEAWKKDAPDAVVDFFNTYVHDSKAGFILGVEPFSYFRPRGVTESQKNALKEGWDWMDKQITDAGDAIKGGIYKAYDATVETGKYVYKTTVDTTKKVYDTSEKAVKKAYEATRGSVLDAYGSVSEAVDTASKTVNKTLDSMYKDASQSVQDNAKQLNEEYQKLKRQMGF